MRSLRPLTPAAVILGGALLALLPSAFAGAGGDQGSDNIVPIAQSIQSVPNVEVALGKDRKVTVSLPYARQGAVVFPLPVWVVQGKPELRVGTGTDARICTPDSALIGANGALPLRLRVRVANLLAGEQTREAAEARLLKDIAKRRNLEKLHLEDPAIDKNGFSVTLCTSGSGQQPEVFLSQKVKLAPAIVQGSGEVDLELLPSSVAAWQADKGRPLTLADTYLKFEGSLKAKFETEQYRANFVAVRQAVTGLQNRVKSITPSASEAPTAIVYVPVPGEAGQESASNAVFSQSLVGNISVRDGADHDLGAIQKLTDRVLQSVLQEMKLASLDDKKRVAFLLGWQVSVSATVGEIRTVAKQTRAQREEQFKKALDDWEARHDGRESSYKGSLGVDVRLPYVPLGVGANISGEMKKRIQEDNARRRQESLETLHKGLDEVKDHFDGKLPTLTGIQFDQKSLSTTLGQVEAELKQVKFTVGRSHYESPPVRLLDATAEVFDAPLLAQQVAEARARYAALKDLWRNDERLQKLAESVKKLEEMEKRFHEFDKESQRHFKEREKQIREREEEVKQVRAEAEAFVKRWAARIPLSERVTALATLKGHANLVNGVAFSPDGKLLVSGSDDNTARLWQPATGALKATLRGHEGTINCVAFSPNGKLLASGSTDNTVRLWNPVTGVVKTALKGHTEPVYCVAFSSDGKLLASGGSDRTVRLWDPATGAQKAILKGHTRTVYGLAFSPNSKVLASASADQTVRLWDPATGAEKATLKGHKGTVYGVAFSPDGRLLASGSGDESVRLWDPVTGDLKATLRGHKGNVNCVAFSPDGELLASASVDTTVRLWDPATGTEKAMLKGHTGGIYGVAFSPDGKLLASASVDTTVRLYHISGIPQLPPLRITKERTNKSR